MVPLAKLLADYSFLAGVYTGIFKLRQSIILKDYIGPTRYGDVGPVMLKSCFLGCLKRELKYDVKLLKPTTVHEAISIAVQLDSKLNDLKPLSAKHVAFHKPHLQLLPQLAAPRPRVLPYKKLTLEKV